MKVSVIIRTYNEEKYLTELLKCISSQKLKGTEVEVVVVDSGSTDSTLAIAHKYGCNIVQISKNEFTFGRSLNIGCQSSGGDYLVFISGHCIPAENNWLRELVSPLQRYEDVVYTYGRQVGVGTTKYSEHQIFRKYYPETSKIPQDGFFCNNANAAIKRSTWRTYRFNEDITGLEDMELAKRLVNDGCKIGYVATASVYHIHHEGWHKIKMRYERESLALQYIMPEVHIRLDDFFRYFISAVFLDLSEAWREKKFSRFFIEILLFRFMQFWGAYRGNHAHRKLSRDMKEKYFYPR